MGAGALHGAVLAGIVSVTVFFSATKAAISPIRCPLHLRLGRRCTRRPTTDAGLLGQPARIILRQRRLETECAKPRSPNAPAPPVGSTKTVVNDASHFGFGRLLCNTEQLE